jgi:predicted amidophosphoribosyltransferase
MPTVGELSTPYGNYLIPVRPVGSGVCSVCRTSVVGDWTRCWQCYEAQRRLPSTADVVAFIALAVKGEQLAHELSGYKNSQSAEARGRMTLGLAAVLWRWLASHESCVAAAAGAEAFDVVTTVPSTSGRASAHPLRRIVADLVRPTSGRFVELLTANPSVSQERNPDIERWRCPSLNGEALLLIDDTWTTGSAVQSAAARLRERGASKVAIVGIGRHFSLVQAADDYREAAKDYYRAAKAIPWSWDSCCLE